MQIGKWKITVKDLTWLIVCLLLLVCGFIGLFTYANACASAILSGASTAISIVLSIVAILYTMIEGANSSRINQESLSRLNQLDTRIEKISERTIEMNELKAVLGEVIPAVNAAISGIKNTEGTDDLSMFDEKTQESIKRLTRYIQEDIDD